MLTISVPGFRDLYLEHIVLDYNGTLACEGELIEGVKAALEQLSENLRVHVVTADTFGNAQSQLHGVPCQLVILPKDGQDVAKRAYVRRLGADCTVAVGNGRNDRLMLKEAALGITVVEEEGAAADSVLAADAVCPGILSALELLSSPLRLIATLRS